MFRTVTVFLLFLVFFSSTSFSQIPPTLSYQGVLKDASGVIVPNANYNLTFRIYSAASGGSALWTEAQSVAVTDGIFNVVLGSTVVLNLPFDVPYWLGITVGTGSELSPRIQLTSAAYSLNSHTVVNNAVTTAKIADGAVTQVKLAPGVSLPPGGTAGGDLTGTYPNPTIVANAVTTAKINDGAVTQAKLAPGVSLPPGGTAGGDLLGSYPNPSVDGLYGRDISSTPPGPGQVLKWDGNYWSPSDDNAGSSVWATSGDDIYNTNSGKVGIGTTTPFARLDINTTDSSPGLRVYGQFGFGPSLSLDRGSQEWRIVNWDNHLQFVKITGSTFTPFKIKNTSFHDALVVAEKGVGVGTDAPLGRLHSVTHGKYAGYFTSDSLSDLTHAIHAVYLGVGFHDGVGIYAKSVPATGFGFGGIFEGGYYAARMDGNLWINGTYDSYFRPNFSGNSAVVLPDNAIASPEMFDEPGIASQLNGSSITLNSTVMQDLQTISITLPAPGYVVLNAKCYIRFSGTTSGVGARIQIDQTAGGGSSFPYYQFIYFPALQSTSIHSFPVSVQRTYYFAAGGLQTFRLEGARETSNGTTESWDHIITAVYYPTSYGSVTEMVENPGGNPEARLITTNRPAENNEPNSAYEVDLRYYELQAAKARAEAEKAERELMEARAKISTQ